METLVGIWIDRDEAVLVRIADGVTRVTRHQSQSRIAPHERLAAFSAEGNSDRRSYLSRRDEVRRNQLHKFYRRVMHDVADAKRLFIFGPGEARLELKKEMRKDRALLARIIGSERAARMTEEQIVAKVEAFFHVGEPRGYDA